MSRQIGRDLSPQEADEQFYPGIRFFFDTGRVFRHPQAEWDGIHPVKIRQSLQLDPYLHALVAPCVRPDETPLTLEAPKHLRTKIVYLDHRKHFGLSAWSNAAFRAAMSV